MVVRIIIPPSVRHKICRHQRLRRHPRKCVASTARDSRMAVRPADAVRRAAMATGRAERRLAAILAADVAGYSRLMGTDEEGTVVALKAIRPHCPTGHL